MKNLQFLVIIIFLCASSLFSQKETYNWYFGNNAGITFLPNGGPPVALTNGALVTEEGSASISDKDGNLLFYTNGINVWNADHQRMPNGFGLKGDISSTHSALIIPLPGSNNLFYIFTVGNELNMNGFQYSIVDMQAGGGKGDVVSKNIMINSNSTERVAAVKHSNGTDVWVTMHEDNNAVYKSYLLNETGIDMNPITSTIGTPHDGLGGNIIGYLKMSPDGKKLAVAIMWKNTVDIFDFNNCTGELSNPISLESNIFKKAYGIEFSPDGTKLYIASTDMRQTSIYQVDLSAGTYDEIMNSVIEIGQYSNYVGAMQLGPDGKVYVGKWDTWLGVINNPNVKGVMCNYDNKGVNLLGRSCRYGLPTFVRQAVKSLINGNTTLCEGDTLSLSIGDIDGTIEWRGPNGLKSTEKDLIIYDITTDMSGWYYLTITDGRGCVQSAELYIEIFPSIHPEIIGNKFICNNQNTILSLKKKYFLYSWSTGQQSNSISVDKKGFYYVSVVDSNGCEGKDSIFIDFIEPIKPNLGQDTLLCYGEKIMLDAGESFTDYLWQDGSKSRVLIANKSGLYWVEVMDTNGCFNSDTINISVSPKTKPELGDDISTCFQDKVTLNVGGHYISYIWQDGSTKQSLVADSSGTYWVEVMDTNGCIGSDTINIEYFSEINFDIGNDTSICHNYEIMLNAKGSYLSYKWQDGSSLQTFNVQTEGTYWVEVTDSNGCTGSDTIAVNYYPELNPDLGRDTTLCNGIEVELKTVDTYTGYRWSNGSNEPIIFVNTGGSYWVEVTDSNGCKGYDTVNVLIEPKLADKVYLWLDSEDEFVPNENYNIRLVAYFKDLLLEEGSKISFETSLSFHSSSLLIDSVINSKIVYDEIIGDRHLLSLRIENVVLSSDTTILAEIIGKVMLADSSINEIKIDDFTWQDKSTNCDDVIINKLIFSVDVCAFNLRHIKVIKPTTFELNPNPASESFNIEIKSDENGNFKLKIYSVESIEYFSESWSNNTKGMHESFVVDISTISSGVYLVVLESPWEIISKRLIIIK